MDFKKKFKGKNILVTGSSSGLGLELISTLNDLDSNLILLNRNKKMPKKFNKAKIINCDLFDINNISTSINEVLHLTKKIDIIYHIAGGGLGMRDALINPKDFGAPSSD